MKRKRVPIPGKIVVDLLLTLPDGQLLAGAFTVEETRDEELLMRKVAYQLSHQLRDLNAVLFGHRPTDDGSEFNPWAPTSSEEVAP